MRGEEGCRREGRGVEEERRDEEERRNEGGGGL